jgi:hypothetical protein
MVRPSGVSEAAAVADREQRPPAPERGRNQQQAGPAQLVLTVETLPVQPVVPPPQLLVQRAEQRLVAPGREHRHPPGDIAVERTDHAVPPRRRYFDGGLIAGLFCAARERNSPCAQSNGIATAGYASPRLSAPPPGAEASFREQPVRDPATMSG